MTANVPKSSKVFISYSCESSQHNKRVLELSNRLRDEGLDCNIDQYEDCPPEGWFLWMINQIEEADFVLIVCTEKYERRFRGKVEAGKGRGAKWEGAIITQNLYDSESYDKCIPIVFSPDDSKYIPSVLKNVTCYDLSAIENYDKLRARLTGQKLVPKPPLGKVRPLEPNYPPSVLTVQAQEVKLAKSEQKPELGTLRTIEKGSKPVETLKTFTSPSTGMEFILIPAGNFLIGSPSNEKGRYDDEGPAHEVTIKDPFYLGKYPVTQKQWIAVIGNNPSHFEGDDQPVESVSWDDVQKFIKKLNEMEETDKYRLPSEAEWEYACRAGTITRYSFGDDESKLKDYCWYSGYSTYEEWEKNQDKILEEGTHSVGQKKPNTWGLYDMHGNVWEWCQDNHSNCNCAPSDGSAWEVGDSSFRVLRGGSWFNLAGGRRSAHRYGNGPGDCNFDVGFRLLRKL